MSKRKQHHPEFKAKVALDALKGEETGLRGKPQRLRRAKGLASDAAERF